MLPRRNDGVLTVICDFFKPVHGNFRGQISSTETSGIVDKFCRRGTLGLGRHGRERQFQRSQGTTEVHVWAEVIP